MSPFDLAIRRLLEHLNRFEISPNFSPHTHHYTMSWSISSPGENPQLDYQVHTNQAPSSYRQPFSSVTQDDHHIYITVELPDVKDADDITIEAHPHHVTINAVAQPPYRNVIQLPNRVQNQRLEYTFNNGVLDVKLPLANASAPPS